MTIFLIILLAIIFKGASLNKNPNGFYENYLSKNQTTNINGIFVLLVFFSHSRDYLDITGPDSALYLTTQNLLRQAVVTTFLFYTGYATLMSIKKNSNYAAKVFKKGVALFIKFDIAVLGFMLVNVVSNKSYPLTRNLMALTTLETVGNSSWYITCILLSYLFIAISFSLIRKRRLLAILLVTSLLLGYIFIGLSLSQPLHTMDTILLIPLGMLYGEYQEKIDKFINTNLRYMIILSVLSLAFAYFARVSGGSLLRRELKYMAFVLVVVLLSRKIVIDSPILYLLGKNVFPIYILQRMPMIFLRAYHFNNNILTFVALSFIGTLLLTIIFNKVFVMVDKRIVTLGKETTLSPISLQN